MDCEVQRVMGLIRDRMESNTVAAKAENLGARYQLLDTSKASYRVNDFFKEEEREFLFLAYNAILKRNPDPAGLSAGIWRLEEGSSLIEELWHIRCSPEGEQQGVYIWGLRLAKYVERFSQNSLLGTIFRKMGILPRNS